MSFRVSKIMGCTAHIKKIRNVMSSDLVRRGFVVILKYIRLINSSWILAKIKTIYAHCPSRLLYVQHSQKSRSKSVTFMTTTQHATVWSHMQSFKSFWLQTRTQSINFHLRLILPTFLPPSRLLFSHHSCHIDFVFLTSIGTAVLPFLSVISLLFLSFFGQIFPTP